MEQNKCGKIDGIILNLFKRKLFQNAPDVPFYDDMLLGFYDGVVLTYPEKWLDFGPEGVDALLDNRNREIFQKVQEYNAWEKFSGTYPVKLLFPREKCQKNMEKSYGFDFSAWKKDSKDQSPLFAALLLNVTDRFIAKTAQRIEERSQNGKSEYRLSIVAQTIWEAIRSIKSEDTPRETISKVQELHCGLFQCIGYYDYALLFRSDNWNMIYRIADQLKSWNIAPTSERPEYFLSNDYLLLGMSNKENAWRNIDPRATCEMSVQINLREGHSVEEFYHAFLHQLEKRDGRNSDSWRFWNNSTNFYQVNGGADCIIMTKSPGMRHVLREFAEKGLFTPGSDKTGSFFRSYIADITTSARRCLKNPYNNKQDDGQGNNKLPLKEDYNSNGSMQRQACSGESNIETKLLSWIRAMMGLSPYWSQDSAFIRRAHGMQQLLAQYENLIGNDSAFDIRKVLQPAYKILYLNLTNLKQAWEQEYEKLEKEKNPAKSYQIKGYMRKYQERIYRLLTDFREKVGGFQDALQLSDRHFIESVRINHPSLGSSTKLLLAYNQLLNQFVEEMGEKLKSKPKNLVWIPCKYQFLLSCGGQDRAKAWNISEQIPSFNGESKNCRNEEALIVMNMSERSIFDIRGTMIRMLHEMWHYCGHRKRTLRCECIVAEDRKSVV